MPGRRRCSHRQSNKAEQCQSILILRLQLLNLVAAPADCPFGLPAELHIPIQKSDACKAAQDEERSEAGHEGDDSSPASRVRQRYERMFRERDHAEALSDDAARAADAAREAANAAARTAFHGSIATVFTQHLR